ncbi:hypothetical protein JRO89_XS04G0030400 [Xanthoceras sorbifolium]|uniref:NB-ARC domain-containing protein n=1 Tax=Xanthoceras sorbifolium TaxID=99658 RepID=A0ABQ8I4B5_9ROSI|nr:hypothetical protein JRO89_XS04G0030400 [Xanthoceras sorbifolium]
MGRNSTDDSGSAWRCIGEAVEGRGWMISETWLMIWNKHDQSSTSKARKLVPDWFSETQPWIERDCWRDVGCCLPAVYGRHKDKAKILEMVFRDEPSAANFHVISIVGMEGIGKSTLAREVSVESFELKAWVCISNDFDICSKNLEGNS